MIITLGIGAQNTQGREVEIPNISALISTLHAHTAAGAWWAPHRWEGAARSAGDVWIGSGIVVLDVDMMSEEGVRAKAEGRKPAAEDHIALPAETLASVELLAVQGGLRASAWHPTPRGLRLIRWMASETTDAAVYRATAEAACGEAQAALAGVRGLVVDRAASCDLKRLMWGPRALVGGVQRTASVAVLRAEPWQWVSPPADVAKPKRAARRPAAAEALDEAPEESFRPAAARWNRDHAQTWPRVKEVCPICGDDSASPAWSVGDEPERWACFSSRHAATGVGQAGPQAWHGDELDLAAALAGLRPYDVLVRDGYLKAPGPRPATVSAPRPKVSRAEGGAPAAPAVDREPGCDDGFEAPPAVSAPVALRVIQGGPNSAPPGGLPWAGAPHGAELCAPQGFALREGGVFREVETKEGETKHTFICPPIYISSRARDILTGDTIYHVTWRSGAAWDGLDLAASRAMDPRELSRAVSDADFPLTPASAKPVAAWLEAFVRANADGLPTGRVSSALGWIGRDGNGGYLWGTERIRGAGEAVRFRGLDAGEAQHAEAMHHAGTLEGWQAAIAPMLALPASMALWTVFAAPLLPLLGRTGCTVHLSGGGQGTGKSAACYAAMSAVGQPRAVSMGWRGTAVSHERRLALCGGGMPLYFDDARECHPQEVLAVLMSVTNGRGKGRGSTIGMRADASWKTMLLSTGEEPATASATHGGEVARTIEVTELPWGTKGTKEGARLVREVTRGTEEHYGHALPEFVRRVTERYTADDLRAAWRALVAELSDAVRPEDGDFGYRLAEHRAVLVLASKLAYELGIVTSRPVAMSWASSETRAGERSEEERARARIASWVASEAVRFVGSEAHAKAPANSGAVWGRWSEVDGTVAILSEVLRERLREWKFSPDIAIEGAARRGWIRRDGKHLTHKVAIEGRGRPRCYVWHLAGLFD